MKPRLVAVVLSVLVSAGGAQAARAQPQTIAAAGEKVVAPFSVSGDAEAGVATEGVVDEPTTESFEAVTFKPSGVAIYQLGTSGTASKKLWQTPGRAASAPAAAQRRVPDSDYAPALKPEGHIAATDYVMPDVPDDCTEGTAYKSPGFSSYLTLVGLMDYNAFAQDSASKAQVGAQDNQWDVRSLRFMTHGAVKSAHPVDYFISVSVADPDAVKAGADAVGLSDWYVRTPLGHIGELRYGKVKEPFIYEIVGDAANLPQQERILNPFFVSRATGFRLDNTMAGDRMSWSVGWFNSWWEEREPFNTSPNDFAGRLTGLPYLSKDGDIYVHLAAALRYAGDTAGVMQFHDRPNSN